MKILVTSDNHLGFKETDPIRSEDSFDTFDEILSIATRIDACLVLQGGDLFHENRPSRNTYNKTVKILKKYCLGNEKPRFSTSIPINVNDSNMNVKLPIFSIHGNHDDPSGFNSISPLDILHSGGFVNYFGRVEDVDDIELRPILIEGESKIALYGMGHIKDRRVYKTFLTNKVRYVRPPGDDWISILMVHQNRTIREQEYLPEDLIDPLFDLVIYGHEHESIKIRHKNFDVIQCGSTVRTSLCEGEVGDKFAYVLDIQEKSISIDRIRLETVRPFMMSTVKILNGNAEQQIINKIEELMEKCREEYRKNMRTVSAMLPLLRLRIEIDSKLDFNKHRITEMIEPRIANPNDAIRITRKTQKEIAVEKHHSISKKNQIEDIYKDLLNEVDLKALVQNKVIESLNDFVIKDSKEAFTALIKDSIEEIIKSINMDDLMVESIDEAIKNARERIYKANNPAKDDIFSVSEGVAELNNKDSEIIDLNDRDVLIDDLIGSNRRTSDITPDKMTDDSYVMSDKQDILNTIPLPDRSAENNTSSINISKTDFSNGDFTFLEDRLENEENKTIVEKVKTEFESTAKKHKNEDSEEFLDIII